MAFDAPGRQDRARVPAEVPAGPYSFEGKLITILWSVEVVAEPGSEAGRQDIVVSPDRTAGPAGTSTGSGLDSSEFQQGP